ncbi:MAG: hypothetical protein GX896_05190 [Clostridiales bacterium]|nr:hypothetical protein [Clostridiales bacterium]
MFNKFLCVLLTLCMSLILVSCNGRKAPNNKNDLELNNNELESPKFVTPPVKYIFPEFLLDTERITLLSRELYNSFDIGSANKDISSVYLGQIVSNFCFSEGKYYRYRYNSRFGIVDAEGKVKLEANYSEIKQIRSDLFLLSNFGTGEKSYAYVNSDKEFVITPKGEYDWIYLDNQLKISQTDQELANVDENVVGKIQYFIESPN